MSSDAVNGSTPNESSSRATRIAKQRESRPESSRFRSSDSGASLTFCSDATFWISDSIVNFVVISWPHICRLQLNIFVQSLVQARMPIMVNTGLIFAPPKIRCRRIEDADAERVVALFTRGFGARRTRQFWERVIARLAARAAAADAPGYGYLLESEG